jgi:hypothetical protein
MMSSKEYVDQKVAMEHRHTMERNDLARKYALENSIAKVGDVVTDGRITVKVDIIRISVSGVPACVYSGIQMTKKGTLDKGGKRGDIYQVNVKFTNPPVAAEKQRKKKET